jgi:hypothetical protein
VELRSDIAAAAARMTSRYEVQQEIRQLPAYLREGETVHRPASGIYGPGPGLLALTNHRILLLRDGHSGQASEGFPLERLSVAEWNPRACWARSASRTRRPQRYCAMSGAPMELRWSAISSC